jgi:DNA-binding transcriptional LysR family regulator
MFIRQLEYLAALDRERHFGRAAVACRVSQPALSSAISGLERELGLTLVRRGRRFEGFTSEGERVLVWVHRALEDLDRLGQEASRLRGGMQGTLRIGAIPTSLPVSTLVTSPIRERHPRLGIQVMSMTSRQIADGLRAGDLDAGLTYLDNEPLSAVSTQPLWRERYLLLTAADGPMAAVVTVSWRCASTLQLCLLSPDMQHRRIVDAAFAGVGVVPAPVIETNSISTLIAHAGTGVPGITAHTWLYGHSLSDGVRAVPLVDPVIEHTIGLVTASGRRSDPVIAELMAMLAPLELDAFVQPARAAVA